MQFSYIRNKMLLSSKEKMRHHLVVSLSLLCLGLRTYIKKNDIFRSAICSTIWQYINFACDQIHNAAELLICWVLVCTLNMLVALPYFVSIKYTRCAMKINWLIKNYLDEEKRKAE